MFCIKALSTKKNQRPVEVRITVKQQDLHSPDGLHGGHHEVHFQALYNRGFPHSFRRAALKEFPRPGLSVSYTIPLVILFSLDSIKRVRDSFKEILAIHSVFSDHRIIAAYRRNKNLLAGHGQSEASPDHRA